MICWVLGALCLAAALYWTMKTYVHRTDESPRGLKIVITGGTRGIGNALVKQFLELGDHVVFTGRSQSAVDAVLRQLQADGATTVFGIAADVTDEQAMQQLQRFATKQLGEVDVWINNAGVSVDELASTMETSVAEMRRVVDINLIGSLINAKIALNLFREQGRGHLWLMDGAGANGMATPNFAAYGASKASLPQLRKSLRGELKAKNLPLVHVSICSPGMVITDLLTRGKVPEPRTGRIFNILAERADTVAQWLVPRIRGARSSTYVAFLTTPGAVWRFATAFRRKNKFFDQRTGAPVS